MRTLLMIISYFGLGLTIIPSILVFKGVMSMDMNKNLMMLGTVMWFGTVAFWMDRKKKKA